MDCDQPIEELIERSSFGAPKARSLSDRTPEEIARRIVDRVRDHVKGPETDSVPCTQVPEAVGSSSHTHEAHCQMAGEATSTLVQRLLDEWEWRTVGQLLDPVRLAATSILRELEMVVANSLLASFTHESAKLDEAQSAVADAFVGHGLGTGKTSSLARLAGSYARHTPVHRCMLVFDIAGFSRPDHSTRLALRIALRDLLDQSLSSAGIDWTQMELADFGDGALVLLDPQVSGTRPLHPLVSELARSLAHYNHPRRSTAQLRLRMAVHSGEVQRTEQGFVGEDLDVAFRLLSAQALRNRLAHSRHADLALIVSDQCYKRVVAHADPAIGTSFRSVRVRAKAGTTKAWVGLPVEGDLVGAT